MTASWPRRLMLAGVGLAAALLVGEIAARIVLPLLPDPPGTAWIRDPACRFRLRPSPAGALPEDHDDHINRYGFRDRNYPEAKPDSVFRVLGIGDSFVYGAVPIGENFLRVAERRLRAEDPARPAEILLLGVPGFSPEHETALLESFGLGLDPDLVLLNFFVGNDVSGLPVKGQVVAGRMYFTHSPDPWLNLLRKSRFFQLAEGVWYRRWKERRTPPPLPDLDRTGPVPVDAPYLRTLGHNLPVYRAEPDRRLQGLWAEAEGYLDRFAADCAGAGVPWLLVLIPGEVQVDPAVRAEVLAGLGRNPAEYDFEAPQKRLRAWAADRGVPVLDLLPVLRAAHADSARLYVPNNTHWNARGNAVAGAAVAAAIDSLTR